MAELGAFLVPTTVTYAALKRAGVAAGMPAELVAKVGAAVEQVSLGRVLVAAGGTGFRLAWCNDALGPGGQVWGGGGAGKLGACAGSSGRDGFPVSVVQ